MVEMVSLMMFALLIALVIGLVLYLVLSTKLFVSSEQIQEKLDEPIDFSWVGKAVEVVGKVTLYVLIIAVVVLIIVGLIFCVKKFMTYKKYQNKFLLVKVNWLRMKNKVDFLSEAANSDEKIKKIKEDAENLYKEIIKLKMSSPFSIFKEDYALGQMKMESALLEIVELENQMNEFAFKILND